MTSLKITNNFFFFIFSSLKKEAVFLKWFAYILFFFLILFLYLGRITQDVKQSVFIFLIIAICLFLSDAFYTYILHTHECTHNKKANAQIYCVCVSDIWEKKKRKLLQYFFYYYYYLAGFWMLYTVTRSCTWCLNTLIKTWRNIWIPLQLLASHLTW